MYMYIPLTNGIAFIFENMHNDVTIASVASLLLFQLDCFALNYYGIYLTESSLN